jgi:hypothetical protein
MDKPIMDVAQLLSWIIAMIAAIVTAKVAISNLKKSIEERRVDILWKRANAANEFIHEMHENKQSAAAVSMLDWFRVDKLEIYQTNKISRISYTEILKAIEKFCDNNHSSKERDNNYSPNERYILECFDWFFSYIDRIEQHIKEGLFLYSHVKPIFFPYYLKISENRNVYNEFMKLRNYTLAIKFWERFEKKTT